MATYEEIHGKRVDVFDSDPTLNSSYEGQVWYDSASGALKTVVKLGLYPPAAVTALCVCPKVNPPFDVAVIGLVEDHAAKDTTPLSVPVVELYHTCPSFAADSVGSASSTSTRFPYISS